MKKLILFTTIFFICFFSCKKDEDEPDKPEPGTITAVETKVCQLEFAILTSNDITFSKISYSGTIGGENVELFVSDTILSFLMPEITAGSQTLTADIENNIYTINFNVIGIENVINPDIYIENSTNDFTYSEEELNNSSTLMADMYGSEHDDDNIEILIAYLDDFQTLLNSASAEDKQTLANFISANPDIFEELEDLTQYIESSSRKGYQTDLTPEDRIEKLKTEFANRITNIGYLTVSGVALQAYALYSPELVTKLLAAAAWAAVIYKVKQLNDFLIIKTDVNVFQVGLMILSNKKSAISFNNETEYSLNITSSYRNLNQQDVNSSYSTIASIVSSLNTFEDFWSTIMGILPTSLTGGSFHIKNVTNEKKKTFNVSIEYLSINNISNSNINVDTSYTADEFKVTFSTTETTQQDFTFDLVYNNPNVSTSTTNIIANLIVAKVPTVITTSITDVTSSSANCTGTITDEGDASVTEQGVIWAEDYIPTVDNNLGKATADVISNEFTVQITGLDTVTTYIARAYAINSIGTGYGDTLMFTTLGWEFNYITFIDSRDGHEYKAIQIGNQIWMAENLAYEGAGQQITDTDVWQYMSDSDGWCYYDNDKATYGSTYGVLYQWEVAKEACPSGWHLPSDAEWKKLEIYLGMSQAEADGIGLRGTDEGSKLKETGTTHWNSPNTGATNISGFIALPGGYRYVFGDFAYFGQHGTWWSSTDYDALNAWYRGLYYYDAGIRRDNIRNSYGFSVRCVMD